MLRVAYVTPYACGVGHAVRGAALVRASQRAGIELRAFGPPIHSELEAYEGSHGWEAQARAFAPQLLLGDLSWQRLEWLRATLDVPAWLLMRWVPPAWFSRAKRIAVWERLISTEPAADSLRGITDRLPPITVETPRFAPRDGQELQAGYNTWWEADWFGYRDRVSWQADTPERKARIAAGGSMEANGATVLMGEVNVRLR